MGIRVLLVSREGEVREAYVRALTENGVEYDMVASFHEITVRRAHVPYNGLLVDMQTLMKSSASEKAMAEECLRTFPFARLNWMVKADIIKVLASGRFSSAVNSLDDFINRDCCHFPARLIRLKSRVDLNFNAIVSLSSEFLPGETEETVTINVSSGGCFLFSTRTWHMKTKVWIKFMDLADTSPVVAFVCWNLKWGVSMRFPGIGVEFAEISQEQLEELCLKRST